MSARSPVIACLLAVTLLPSAMGQDRERRGGRGWDSDRGGERGFEDRGDRRRGEWGRGDWGRGRRGGPGDGPPGRGGFDPVSRLDANQNGIIDQSEIDAIPERYRVMMDARGFQLQSGESVDDVRGRMRERFERAREDRERRERDEDGDSRVGDSGRANRSTPPPPFRPRDRERITVDLPESWVEVDTDLDGQLGLYEWIVARRSELELFDTIDRNGDGLLTPRELVAWDALKSEAGKTTLTAKTRERLVIVGGVASDGSSGNSGRTGSGEQSEGEERSRRAADWTFSRMDRDDDGTISMEEWSSSRRIRPWFESAGIEIRPMSVKEFTAIYQKLSRERQDSGRRR